MGGQPDNYDQLGYKRIVKVEYNSVLDATFIKEYVYGPDEDDKNVDVEIDHCLVTMYVGKPNIEKTKKFYHTVKTLLWKESIGEVVYDKWDPTHSDNDFLDDCDYIDGFHEYYDDV